MAFKGFGDTPGPARPPKNRICFGVLTGPPSASETSSQPPPLSSFVSSPPPPPQQRPAFSFDVSAALPSASLPLSFRSYTSKDMPPKEKKQQAEILD